MNVCILIIDDDPVFLAALSELLEEQGHNVLRATTIQAASDLLSKHRAEIGLVLVDLVLRGESGFDLIAVFKRKRRNMKIIAMSRYFRATQLYLAKRIGADAALEKPGPGAPLPKQEWLELIGSVVKA